MIIGLAGLKRSGKDTVGQNLVEDFGFTQLAFADALREVLYDLNPIIAHETSAGGLRREWVRVADVVDRMGWQAAKDSHYGPEIRVLQQRLGTEAIRKQDRTFWTVLAEKRMTGLENVVITDMRFANEGGMVMHHRGFLVEIVRPDLPDTDGHASEHEWRTLPFDAVLMNDGTLDDLRRKTADLVKALGG